MLIDDRGRRYLVRLRPGETWHSHGGAVRHDAILGSVEGARVRSTGGMSFVCFRPRLADFVLKMPRGAQVVYPKDLGAILVEADIHPGARVLEAGTGSGALTLALSRSVGPDGRVVSYELRPEFHAKAVQNLEAFFGKLPGWVDLREGDVTEVVETGETFDRVVLDMPEPWGPLPAVLALQALGFEQVATFEVLHRPWHVTERSVRPDHRMVAHTGFITVARRGGDAD